MGGHQNILSGKLSLRILIRLNIQKLSKHVWTGRDNWGLCVKSYQLILEIWICCTFARRCLYTNPGRTCTRILIPCSLITQSSSSPYLNQSYNPRIHPTWQNPQSRIAAWSPWFCKWDMFLVSVLVLIQHSWHTITNSVLFLIINSSQTKGKWQGNVGWCECRSSPNLSLKL